MRRPDWKTRALEVATELVERHCPSDARFLEVDVAPAWLEADEVPGALAFGTCIDVARVQVLNEQDREIRRLESENAELRRMVDRMSGDDPARPEHA